MLSANYVFVFVHVCGAYLVEIMQGVVIAHTDSLIVPGENKKGANYRRNRKGRDQ